VPVFGLATSRNSASLHAVSDTLLEVTWVLTKGASGKTVYAERTFTDNHVDTVYDGILVRPWHVAVTLRNDTSGPGQTMRRVGEALVSGTGLVPSVCIYRPWVDFSVDIGGDSSFALDFGAWLLVPQSQWTLDSTSPLLRTGRLSCALSGSGAAHAPSRVYHYSFHPDSADGAANIDTLVLFRKTTTPPYETVLSTLAPVSPRRNYDTLCHLSGSDRLAVGRKEMALVLSFHGRYFDDARTVTVSPRLDHSSPFVLCYDAYPPSVHRDFWEYVYPADGAVIDSLFTINLNATGEVYDSSGNQLLQRGLVWDKGGADITGIDLILAEMSDETAARWTSDTMWNKTTLSDLLSVRHYRFGFPIPVPGPQVYPVAWYDIDPSQWNDGWYYVAIVTTDSYGNRDIAPFYAGWGKDYLITHNPQHWRIVTPYHTF